MTAESSCAPGKSDLALTGVHVLVVMAPVPLLKTVGHSRDCDVLLRARATSYSATSFHGS